MTLCLKHSTYKKIVKNGSIDSKYRSEMFLFNNKLTSSQYYSEYASSVEYANN